MASIESLLNPLPDLDRFCVPSSAMSNPSSVMTPRASSRQKREKAPKDAAIFKKDKIRGELRYPPCEQRNEELTRIHREFQLYPMGEIASYPRHIPYNSDKKSFQERTGRESFEVLQYEFTIPGEDKRWMVMWDYNIGLVRTTHLFKCQDYSKTTPAKMLNANPGLRDICHSITGGALAAQGYWMPFEAAKAVAATFCWRIRHVLTPIFGLDFIDMCIHPQDRGRYGRMIIHKSIVDKSTEMANYYRSLELQSPPQQPLLTSRRPACPSNLFEKQILPKSFDYHHHAHQLRHDYADSLVSYGSSPEYNSGTSTSDAYCMSPVSPCRNTFTPVNTPRSNEIGMGYSGTASPRGLLCSLQNMSRKRANDSSDGESGSGSSDTMMSSSTQYSSTTTSANTPSDCLLELDDVDVNDEDDEDDDDGDYRDSSDDEHPSQSPSKRPRASHIETRSRRNPQKLLPGEVKAAHALLSLYMQDATGSGSDEEGFMRWQQQNSGRKRRRASA
ncbi:hypothetical protein P170DRAFT_508297 [Aspergillus steynii IBT 23096]|uniref:HTH APSES-type domain-containing protein n=1 Tax=Aspergillus steynii IBT 23096 TaxID=1392250 RepID=A0A2I2GB32_9EURO|nr:uncharacterized protein P170DRAFT_508297 [Aspergillus steynii IBT 23096]PLB50057.1 hypothetical protein P170DRAFT_508297 [Aspergillus steynii IBT 23096]